MSVINKYYDRINEIMAEIWDKEKWAKCDEEISADEIAENMTMLGI